MDKVVVSWRVLFWRHGLPLVALLGIVASLAYTVLSFAKARGLYPGVIGFFADADHLLAQGSIGSAFYPPLTTWLVAMGKVLYIPLHPAIFNGAWLLAGTGILYVLLFLVTKHRGWAWIGTLCVLLNPYFIWTAMLSNDTALEWVWLLCVVLTLFIGIRQKPSRWMHIVMVLGAAGSTLTRATGLYVIGALLVAAWVIERPKLRSLIKTGALSLFSACIILLGWNRLQVGVFTLSTNAGINLYFGNHPAYLQGHPQYDIDRFLGEVAQHDVGDGLSEVEVDKKFMALGKEFIRQDPAAFIYRSLIKSYWYWVGLEKIPNYSGGARLDVLTGTIQAPTIDVRQALSYTLYRVICLAVIAYWILKGRSQTSLAPWLVWAGWVGLWPIMIMTFPDTRFHIVLETLLSAWVVSILFGFWTQRKDLLQSTV